MGFGVHLQGILKDSSWCLVQDQLIECFHLKVFGIEEFEVGASCCDIARANQFKLFEIE